jgi:hypothetical protein
MLLGAAMIFIQKLVVDILPKRWSEAIQTESQSWLLRCSICGITRSVWEAGGIRFRAASIGKSTTVWCAQCGQLRMMAVKRLYRLSFEQTEHQVRDSLILRQFCRVYIKRVGTVRASTN